MLIIELEFPAGLFHATPWGRHVNEGVPEWPPSPFRLVRALYDVWQRKASDGSAPQVEELFAQLASSAPDFCLPPANASHIRLYMRQGSEDEADKKLVFDPFVVIAPSSVIRIGWPSLALSDEQTGLLCRLLAGLNYFGRAESIAIARIGKSSEGLSWNCRPIDRGDGSPGAKQATEIVQVACVAPLGAHVPIETKKKGKPLDWFDALTWGSSEVLGQRLSDPPALRWVSYCRSRDALNPPPVAHARADGHRVDSMLLALNGKVLPLVTDTVAVAERFRMCAMGASRRIAGGDPSRISPLLAGKDAAGAPLKDHQHACYLPLDQDGDGRIDHILIRCPGGLCREEQLAIAGVHGLWQRKGRPDVQLVLVASGMAAELLSRARTWASVTPFITPRHYKPKRGEYGAWLEEELRRALAQHGLPAPERVEPVPLHRLPLTGKSRRWGEFLRSRKGESPRSGFGFRITFGDDVVGPFSVGYGSHFGLGQFAPERSS